MNITKQGRIPSTTVDFVCRKCGCEFTAVQNLEAQRIHDQRDGDFWKCDCPTPGCKHTCTKAV